MGPSQPPRRRTVRTAATGADTTTASARVAAQRSQAALADTLSARLGSAKGAGSSLDAVTGALVVTVTEPAAAPSVTAAGARVTISAAGTIGGCGAGFQSFFQPVTEALAAYGVSPI